MTLIRKVETYLWTVLTTMLIGALVGLLASCATLKPNPTAPEIQQTRQIAVKIFSAVEVAGNALEGVQTFEIELHDAGKVSDDLHRAFQSDLLITARLVRATLTQIQQATRVPELRMSVQVLITNLTELKNRYGTSIPKLASGIAVVTAGLTIVMTILGGA